MLKNQFWIHARDGVVLADEATGEIVEVNPAAETLLGRSRSVLVGTNQRDLYPAEQREDLLKVFLAAMNDHGIMDGLSIERPDGSRVPVEISASTPFEQGGRRVVMGVFRDVSRQVADRQRLERRAWALTAYAGAATALHSATSIDQLVQAVCESIVREKTYVLAWVGLADAGAGRPVVARGVAGTGRGYVEGLDLTWDADSPRGQGPSGVCIRTRRRFVVDDVEADSIYAPWRERARQFGIRSTFCVPMISGDECLGALMVYAGVPAAYGPEEVDLFEHLASEMAHGIRSLQRQSELDVQRERSARAQAQVAAALEATITAMSATMESRDPYTAGHERRVAELAVAIGQELGWDADRLHGLRMAGLVHDLGKIAVPTEILTKPTKLLPPEFELIKTHAEAGYQIMKDIPFPWPVARMIREHHERLDGSGYPLKLKAEGILPESKVLAVADMVESMASDRPYRPARGVAVALAQVESEAGQTLDASAVAACLTLFRQKGYVLPI